MRDPPGGEYMIDPVSGGATTAAASHLQRVAPSSPSGPGEPQAAPAKPSGEASGGASARPATRVYIVRSDSGIYVYRLLDVATGRVLAELPRSQSDQLKVLDGYAPGAVTSASA